MGRHFTKFMGVRCICTLIDFSQMIVQGLWEKENEIFQIDFFLNKATKYMKRDKYPDFSELVKQPRETRNLPNWVPAEFREEIHNEIDLFPRIKLEQCLTIDDDTVEEMTTDDCLNFTIKLTRENIPEDCEIPFVHSNRFTFIKEEVWYLMITYNEDIFYFYKFTGSSRT